MRLNRLGANKTELELSDGTTLFFSYNTPVAACLSDGGGFVRTDKRWSVTTSKHITQWLDGATAKTTSQGFLDSLASAAR